MSDRVEPTAQERALERLISSLMARVEVLEGQAARSADDNATALAAVHGHDVRLAALESLAMTNATMSETLERMERPFVVAPFTYRSALDAPPRILSPQTE